MSTRRLAAIMFTDIVGYTALMQTDEPTAIALRQRHREVFERQHETYRGQIVQYYGDGTLSVFDSAVDAVACAVAMQREFQAEPQVPLRIGLHTGDILISKTEVIGDGVNLASRVESMAVPGAVLVSESVYEQIKNQPEFEGKSLGLFTFKNVTKPIEVFAIVNEGLQVPNPRTLSGKFLKRTSSEGNWLQRLPIWAKYAAGFLLFLVLAPLIYFPLLSLLDAGASPRTVSFVDASGREVTREVMPAEARRNVYLGTFEVPGNDSTLAWTGLGLPHAVEFDLDQDPYCYTFLDEKEKLTALSPQLQAAEKNRCQYLLRGSLQPAASGYAAQVDLHAVPSGNRLASRRFAAAELLPLADSVSFWVKGRLDLPEGHLESFPDLPLDEMLTRSPKAYASYVRGLLVFISRSDVNFLSHFEQAVAEDSTFAWGAFYYANILYAYQRQGEQLRNYLDLALEHIGRMPDFYAVYVRQLDYKVNGENEKALQLLELMTEMEPNKTSHWVTRISESFSQNKFAACLAAIRQSRELGQPPNFQQLMEAKCLLWLGKEKEGLKIIEPYTKQNPDDQQGLLLQGQLLLAQGKLAEARDIFQRGSLLFGDSETFDDMLAHVDYAEGHQPMKEKEAANYIGTYWVEFLTVFRFELGYALQTLTFQATNQSCFLLYPMTDSTFGTVHGIKVKFRGGETAPVSQLILYQTWGPPVRATPVEETTDALVTAMGKGEWARADSLVGPAMAAAPNDPFLPLLQQHLSFRQTPAYQTEKARYASYAGQYDFQGQIFDLSTTDEHLAFYQVNNRQGLDPFRLYAFKPGHFLMLENTRSYCEMEAPAGKGAALLFHYLGQDQVIRAERVAD